MENFKIRAMFFQKAKVGLNEGWRYAVGALLIFIGWQILASIPLLILIGYIAVKGGTVSMDIAGAAASVGLGKNLVLGTILSSFVLACLCIFLVVKYFHQKPFLSVITARSSFSWKRAAFGFFVWIILGMLLFFVSYQQNPDDYVFSFQFEKFLPLVVIGILLLPFQTSFEELFLRGYAMQGIGTATNSRLWALVLSSVIFGLLHSANPEVMKYGFFQMMIFYIGMGFFLGIMAIMDNGLELPMGVHFANNFMAAVFVNIENSALSSDSLFVAKHYDPVADMPYAIAIMIIFLLITNYFFKWKNWNKLTTRINCKTQLKF